MQTAERRNAILIAIAGFAILGLVSLGVLTLASLLGQVGMESVTNPARWLGGLDSEKAFDILSNSAELLAGVLAIAITVVAIVVELAATRYSHRITKLFISEPVNIAVMCLFLITTLLCVWMAATITEPGTSAILPNAGFGIAMLLVTISLLLLLPYFYFVFSFISPLTIIQKLGTMAHRNYRVSANASPEKIHARALETIDEIQDIARSAAEQGDTRIAMAAIDTFAELALDYTAEKDSLPETWLEIDNEIIQDPDFVSLGKTALQEVRDSRLWYEVKIMRQYLDLMNQTIMESRDIANLIAIRSRQIGIAAERSNPALLALIIRCFNSYLRATIRASDWRTAYFVMNEMRLLALDLHNNGAYETVAEIVEHFRYYASFAFSVGNSFLLEVAAYDIVTLIEEAATKDSPIIDDLLSKLLELDQEIREESDAASLISVRRAQLQLATFFLERGDEIRARRIVDDMRNESFARLETVREALMTEERTQYWEFTDRGVNFSYLAPARRQYLDILFNWLSQSNH